MRIQHNIMAMNAYRNYTGNVSAMQKNLEKLSSGYKINRAGDDAAGLAISEKMRAQISGLEAAQKNAKDGISLVQTAEGALTEVHDMLNRMVTLASQSANGTYDNETDRLQLQKELDQLRSEINRIADSSNFNGIKLLDGSMSTNVVTTGETDISANAAFAIIGDGQLGKTPQAGVFELDLTNYRGTVDQDGNVTISGLFDQADITVKTGAKAGDTVTGEEIAKAIAEQFGTDGTAKFDDYGVELTATNDKAKVTFTMNKAPSKAWNQKFTSNGISIDNIKKAYSSTTDTTESKDKGNQGSDIQIRTLVEPVDTTAGRVYAQAKIDLSQLTIEDGSSLTIGDTTYVFALGKNSSFKDAENVIDLTDMEQADLATNKGILASRVTTAAKDNANFKVTFNAAVGAGGTGVIYLTEKEGGVDTDNYKLEGTSNKSNGKDGDWKGLLKFGKMDAENSSNGLKLQIGDTAEKFNQLRVNIGDCHTESLGIANISIADQESAAAAIDAIKAAINKVSDVRGTLGATQNRLDHTINNLSVMTENIQDAESTIRDTDVAEEMMAYTKNNILIQSAQAMLAQANQVPQGVLQLLQ